MKSEIYYDCVANEASNIILSAPILYEIHNLDIHQLQFFFSQFYYYVDAFQRFLGAVIWQTNNEIIKFALIDNLIDECGGFEKIKNRDYSEAHPEMLKRFVKKLSGNDTHLPKSNMSIHTRILINSYNNLFINSPFIEAIGGIAPGTESTSPKWFNVIYQQLKRREQFSEEDLFYFKLHTVIDEVHGNILKESLIPQLNTIENRILLKNGATTAALILKNFFLALSEEIKDMSNSKIHELAAVS